MPKKKKRQLYDTAHARLLTKDRFHIFRQFPKKHDGGNVISTYCKL